MNVYIPIFNPIKNGGNRILCEIANYLSENQFCVKIIILNSEKLPFLVNHKIEIVPIKFSANISKIMKTLYLVFYAFKIKNDVNAIISNYFTTCYFGFLVKILNPTCKHVYYIQGYEPGFFKNAFIKYLVKKTYQFPTHKIAVSNWIAQKVTKVASKRLNRIQVINNCINQSSFNCENRIANDQKVITTIGSNQKIKGFNLYLQAMTEIITFDPYCKFRIITTEKNLHFTFCNKVNYEIVYPSNDADIKGFYQTSMVFISTSYEEGFGLPALEAMACGTPVITTDNGGCRDYAIHMYNSLVIQPGSIQAIVDSVKELILNDSLRNQLSINGIATAKKFNWSDKLSPLVGILNGN